MIVIAPILLAKNIRGITLWPFIVLKKSHYKEDSVLINHEKIHLRQQIEMLVIPFYIWYIVAYLVHWIRLKDSNAAYLSISFEREAYFHENDLNYLKNRRFWSFYKYTKKKNAN